MSLKYEPSSEPHHRWLSSENELRGERRYAQMISLHQVLHLYVGDPPVQKAPAAKNNVLFTPKHILKGPLTEQACGNMRGSAASLRESSLLTTYWSESTLSSRWFGGPASRHGSLNSFFQACGKLRGSEAMETAGRLIAACDALPGLRLIPVHPILPVHQILSVSERAACDLPGLRLIQVHAFLSR